MEVRSDSKQIKTKSAIGLVKRIGQCAALKR